MRKNTAVITIRIPEVTKAELELLKKNKFNPGEICRDLLINGIKEFLKKIKK
jgi:hypothetical protein